MTNPSVDIVVQPAPPITIEVEVGGPPGPRGLPGVGAEIYEVTEGTTVPPGAFFLDADAPDLPESLYQGPTGPPGPTGATGPAGAAGAPGATGPAGAAGAPGATGPAGPRGISGASAPYLRARHHGYPSTAAGRNVLTYSGVETNDERITQSGGVITLPEAGVWLITVEVTVESTDCVFGLTSSRFEYGPDKQLMSNPNQTGYRMFSYVYNFQAGDTVACIATRSGVPPTLFRPAMSVVFLGGAVA